MGERVALRHARLGHTKDTRQPPPLKGMAEVSGVGPRHGGNGESQGETEKSWQDARTSTWRCAIRKRGINL